MSIFSLDGTQIDAAYDLDGEPLDSAYDYTGGVVWSDSLKVMTYNVGGWYTGSGSNVPAAKKDQYYALQTGMIEDADPDILFINEYLAQFSADGTSALTMLQSLFPYVEAKTSGTYFGRAICSKYPITNYTQHSFTTGTTTYYYDSANVTINGKGITLVVLHLMVNPEADRYLQAQELLAYLLTLDSFIAAGDYNTGISPDYGTDNTESTPYQHYIKLFTDEGFHVANGGDFGFFVTCNDGVDGAGTDWDIDNIITSSDITITSAHVDTTKLTDGLQDKTDHMPLIATVTF